MCPEINDTEWLRVNNEDIDFAQQAQNEHQQTEGNYFIRLVYITFFRSGTKRKVNRC